MKGAAARTNNRFNLMTLVASYPEMSEEAALFGLFINFAFHFAGAMEQLTGSRS